MNQRCHVRPAWWTVSLLALAAVVSLGGAAPCWAEEELPAALKADLKKIDEHLQKLEARVGKVKLDVLDQSIRETKQWISEFAIDAELFDDDPVIKRLNDKLKDIAAKARTAEKSRAEKDAEMEKATAERRKAMEKGEMEMGEDLKVKIPVDLKNVSFKKDVAPILANVCLRCHNSQRKPGDFDASTYNSFITVLEPGNPEASHVLDLVTGKAEPRMPRGGMARFPGEWATIWSAWIKQGAKFDGTKPDALITDYLIDLETQRRAAYAAMSTGDLEKLHRSEANKQIGIVNPSKKAAFFETKNFLVHSTLGAKDAEYAGVLAEAVLEGLQQQFKLPADKPVWRGRLGLNVFADRTDYVAFAKEIDDYAPESSEFGHVRLLPEHQYVALTSDVSGLSLDGAVAQQVTSAFLQQLGNRRLPPWAVYGYSRFVAAEWDPKSLALRDEQVEGAQIAASGKSFMDVFTEKLPWIEMAPMSASFFQYLDKETKRGLPAYLLSFAQSGNWQQSLQTSLKATPQQAASGWANWAATKGKRR